jgi:hypothetical protein
MGRLERLFERLGHVLRERREYGHLAGRRLSRGRSERHGKQQSCSGDDVTHGYGFPPAACS